MRKIKKLTSVILALLILTSCAPAGAGDVSSALIGEWVFAAGVIPENNPKPVDVNREDAATPTPVSYTDKIVGEEMDVEVKIHRTRGIGNYNKEWSSHIAAIRSYYEFKAICDQDVKNPNIEDYSGFYNEEHFNDNAVIMLFKKIGGSDQYAIEKVSKSRGKMQIYLKQTNQGQTTDMGILRIFISVPKEEMEGIKSAVVFREAYSYVY